MVVLVVILNLDGGLNRPECCADIAQPEEQRFCKPQVGGSTPSVGWILQEKDGFPSG